MRIRKRPPSHSLPSRPPPSDPPCQVHPPSARREAKESTAGEVLHPVGDLPIDPHEMGENPKRRPAPGPPLSDPVANGDSRSRERVQVLKAKEGRSVDSNQRWNAKADSSHGHRVRGSSGAVAMGAAAQAKTMEGNDDGNGDGGLETKLVEQEKKAKVKARASADDNDCTSVGDRDKEGCDGGAAVVRAGNGSNVDGTRRRSPAVPVEGSRCSRVNGRGWRCCQKTLVGYSLCEHHLGKGRLRSMRSVRGQSGISKPHWSTGGGNSVAPSTSAQKQPEEEEHATQSLHLLVAADNEVCKIEEDEEEAEKTVRKKRKKIGMVKARSISSLLDGTNHPVLSPSLLSQAPEVVNEAQSSVS
ncbi:unnamed protein product [Musa textilis]